MDLVKSFARGAEIDGAASLSKRPGRLPGPGAFSASSLLSSSVPVQESKLEVFAEVFDHWSAYSSVNSRSINAEASLFSLISGQFSSEHLSMKTHQVSNSAKTTRVQLRHHFYSVKIQPDAPLSSSFKSRILDIAAYLQNNQSDYVEYLAELIVRVYGTHYISSADAGGIVYQLDYISSDYLNNVNVDSRSVTASASFTFLNSLLGNASASFLATEILLIALRPKSSTVIEDTQKSIL